MLKLVLTLTLQKGDIIDILSMNASGQWRGMCHGRKGTFKFINVELLSERRVKPRREMRWHRNIKGKPASVEELLQKINLPEHISVFVLNGYEDLELFKEIEPSDLDYLGIINSEHRAKILTAVQLLHDLDCEYKSKVLHVLSISSMDVLRFWPKGRKFRVVNNST